MGNMGKMQKVPILTTKQRDPLQHLHRGSEEKSYYSHNHKRAKITNQSQGRDEKTPREL